MRAWTAAVTIAAAAAAAGRLPAQQTHLIVITGLSGAPEYADRFARWGGTMVDAAQQRWKLPRANIAYLVEDPARDPQRATGKSTREEIDRAVSAVAQRAAPDDAVLILLIGHGSTQGAESRFSLPGPDLSPLDFDRMLDRLPHQRVALVNAASASGDFVEPLSAKNRTIVTATRSGGEKNETVFAGYFVDAFASDGADADKDGLVSILEAFNFARREVARFYQGANRLQTEHALLDDNGDGAGSREPDPLAGDGAQARRVALVASDGTARRGAPADSALAPLYADARRLEQQVTALRTRKAQMDSTAYEAELERLLLELALKNREIRDREKKP